MNWLPYILIVIGVILSTLGGFWLSHISTRQLKHQLDTVKTELTTRNDKIQELNNFILSSITGGDSFCYLDIIPLRETKDKARLVVRHKGQYPLYDLNIIISDYDKLDFDKIDTAKSDDWPELFASAETRLNFGTFLPNASKLVAPISFTGKTNLKFNIWASARNGGTDQTLRMKLIDKKWVKASRVTKSSANTVIYENIDQDYPRDPKGNVRWD